MRLWCLALLIVSCTRGSIGLEGDLGVEGDGGDVPACGEDTATDVHNCGECGHDCSKELGSSALCVGGHCSSTTCAEGEVVCAGKCVDLRTDVTNCGSCGAVCKACVEGKCLSASPDVDLLVLIDNSRSMAFKQQEFIKTFPNLMKELIATTGGGTFHIGVVTSDLAAGPLTYEGGGSAPVGSTGCRVNGSVRGDGARLINVGAAADRDCKQIKGGNYIVLDPTHPDKSNLPEGQDLAKTFACMAQVGDVGCGMEHQLEAVYQAIGPSAPLVNAGFLRDDALLMVLFVTDEDDCSAPPDTELFAQDNYRLVNGKRAFEELGYYHSFRCTEFGLKCGGKKLARGGMAPTSDCEPLSRAEGGKLYDVDRYIDFFSKTSGVKKVANRVVLASVAGLATQVETLFTSCDRQDQPYPTSNSCGSGSALNGNQCMVNGAPNQMCSVVLQHVCQADNPVRFGDPAVRISKVVHALSGVEASICDSDMSGFATSLSKSVSTALAQ